MLGNWKQFETVLATFGTYGDTGDRAETRQHNQANEITKQDPNPDSPTTYKPFTHDDAGNLRFIPYTVSTGGQHRLRHAIHLRRQDLACPGEPDPG
ncbi:MAG: hypothetical protein KF866_11605 [Phycisphaeraceae bacterium]|nr:hypothetical protein [Phycisphaeraceae bacterium]